MDRLLAIDLITLHVFEVQRWCPPIAVLHPERQSPAERNGKTDDTLQGKRPGTIVDQGDLIAIVFENVEPQPDLALLDEAYSAGITVTSINIECCCIGRIDPNNGNMLPFV